MPFGRSGDFKKYCNTMEFTRYSIGAKWSQVQTLSARLGVQSPGALAFLT
jgi:hypothetical protein